MAFKHYATRVYADQLDENIACAKSHGYDFASIHHPAIEASRLNDGEYFMVVSWKGDDDVHTTKPFHMMFITFDEFVRDRDTFVHEDTIGPLTRMVKN
jgi:hypothetical protein